MSKNTNTETKPIRVYFADEPYQLLQQTMDASGDSISRIVNTLICKYLPEDYIKEDK